MTHIDPEVARAFFNLLPSTLIMIAIWLSMWFIWTMFCYITAHLTMDQLEKISSERDGFTEDELDEHFGEHLDRLQSLHWRISWSVSPDGKIRNFYGPFYEPWLKRWRNA